jgi:phosphatidylglycerol lysyltransferase
LWLYRPAVDQPSDLHGGVVSIAIAFMAGLAGWMAAALVGRALGFGVVMFALVAFAFVLAGVWIARTIATRMTRFASPAGTASSVLQLAFVGWLDWILGAAAFVLCVRAAGISVPFVDLGQSFFLGQALGLASFVPGGFGSSDVFWITHVGAAQNTVAAAVAAYRVVYYVLPWAAASLVLLAWAARRTPRRLEVARRVVAGLVGGGSVLVMLSSASPAAPGRLAMLSHALPLSLVETGEVVAAFAGLALFVLARGLARGYRTAYRVALGLLAAAGTAALLKGFDWEEALVLSVVALVTWSQGALFDRENQGRLIEDRDLELAFAALVLFLSFGTLAYRVNTNLLERWSKIGYRFQAARFLRTAASMSFAVSAGSFYVLRRTSSGFTRLSEEDMARALSLHAQYGDHTNPMMIGSGDKAVFFDRSGFCPYRTIGPYLVVFSDPVVRAAAERPAFLEALFAFAHDMDRRLVLYQISASWIPLLHDRGYDFFKLGEEAHLQLRRVALEGHSGKLYRQILRRAERDGVRFRILTAAQTEHRLAELAAISDDWLRAKGVVERQFSIGFFDADYLRRFPCAIVEEARPNGRILAFANLLECANREELSVDLMRYRSDGPSVMDFLIVSVLFEGKAQGYARFNLGVAPLASVGEHRGAHVRERLARLLFERGERWYNFQGLRYYKEKFGPEWVPRYMAYQHGWEWPLAMGYVSALTAGGWASMLMPARHPKPLVTAPSTEAVEA